MHNCPHTSQNTTPARDENWPTSKGDFYSLNMPTIPQLLDSFFTNPEKNVFALKGDWGVGKTYIITKYIESSPHLSNKVVSYTSLFGVKSIEDLRSQIFFSSYKQGEGTQNKIRNLWIKTLNLAKDVSVIKDHATSLIDLHKDVSAKDSTIVLDDLERRDPALGLGAIFGLVSQLKEQFGCKIILILNEDQLDTSSIEDLKKYREKVIDVEIEYDPPVSTNAKIFFRDDAFLATACDVYESLECNNLRVIKKSYHAFSDFKAVMEQSEGEVRTHFLRQVVLLSCLYYLHGNKIGFSGLEQYSVRQILRRSDAAMSEEDRILDSANFTSSELDGVIVDYLATGILNDTKAKEIIDRMSERERQGQVIEGFRNVFSVYRSNFRSGFKLFYKRLNTYLSANISSIDWNSLSSACTFLKSNNKPDAAKKWIDKWLSSNLSGIRDKSFLAQLSEATENPRLKNTVKRKIVELEDTQSPKEIIFSFVRDRGWDPETFQILLSHSEDYHYKWLKTEPSPELLTNLRQFLRVFRNSGQGTPEKEYCNILEKVLRRIAGENRFNELRVTGILQVETEGVGLEEE